MSNTFYGFDSANVKPLRPRRGVADPRDMYSVLLAVWSAETCAPRMRHEWSPENPTKGQCSVTAFLVQDVFGGRVFGIPLSDGSVHCYNEVAGAVFDLTNGQFGDGASSLVYDMTNEQSRERHFQKEEKRLRYELLKAKFDEIAPIS